MDAQLPVFVFLSFLLLFLYFMPFLISIPRNHHNKSAIFVLNLLLGWTVLGWIAALVWALTKPAPPQVIYVRQDDQPPSL